MPILAPSILSADFAELGQEVARAERGGAQYLHVDVMDGHFVPNLTFGPALLAALRPHTKLFLDVHLMVESPDGIIPAFAEAGADSITVHVEACTHLHRTIQVIRHQRPGIGAAVALNPATPLGTLEEILPFVDMVLLMSVNPGFGGQSFIAETEDKLRRLRRIIDLRGLPVKIEMDGGIGPSNVGKLVSDGLDIAVAGSAVFVKHQAEVKAREMLGHMQGSRTG
ncbi:MAG TPA: ribulose-phosphate 3-epimerase [Candidatus Xenobia bacterium]|jgi:ribulose-phosphate 3-epimerase